MIRCVHCGRLCGNFEGGRASVYGSNVCHPNVIGRPDCYRLITVYRHMLKDCPTCMRK